MRFPLLITSISKEPELLPLSSLTIQRCRIYSSGSKPDNNPTSKRSFAKLWGKAKEILKQRVACGGSISCCWLLFNVKTRNTNRTLTTTFTLILVYNKGRETYGLYSWLVRVRKFVPGDSTAGAEALLGRGKGTELNSWREYISPNCRRLGLLFIVPLVRYTAM
jgi:hypothetical protein